MPDVVRPNIAFAGLTAAGKTTHARLLAHQLGYTWVSYTALLLQKLGLEGPPEQAWFRHGQHLQHACADSSLNAELERDLCVLARTQDGLLLDTWAMAFQYQGPLIRIWIESDEDSRTRKCYVSQGPIKQLDLAGCRQLLREKDDHARAHFQARFAFDLFTDRRCYDAVLSNTDLIAEPTESCAQAGIKTFAPVVQAVVSYLLEQARHGSATASVQQLQTTYGTMVQSVNERPWSFT